MESNYYIHSHGKLHYWYRAGKKPALVFFHAAGFHGYLWKNIADKFEDHEVILIDLPGHGKSDSLSPHFDWEETSRLITQFMNALCLPSAVAIGHSMGGHIALSVAGQGNFFDAVLALDPVVLNFPMIAAFSRGNYNFIQSKRANWNSESVFIHDYKKKLFFASWNNLVFIDYCKHAVQESPQGVTLSCHPDYEASIYRNCRSEDIYRWLSNIHCQTRILRSRNRYPNEEEVSFEYSPTRSNVGDFIANSEVKTLGNYSHFFPMENPFMVIDEIKQLLSDDTAPRAYH